MLCGLVDALCDDKLLLNNISRSNIGDAGGRALGAALQAMPAPLSFTEISLFSCALSAVGIAPIAQACRRGFAAPGLQRLDLRDNVHLGDDGLAILARALPSTLESFAMGSTGCGDLGLVAMARALGTMTHLKSLYCGMNPAIGAVGCDALAAALPRMTALSSLNLSGLHMGDAGMAALASRLPEAPALTKLCLCYNSIGDVGAKDLCKVLPRCLKLADGDREVHDFARGLDLGENQYSAASALALDAAGGTRIQIIHHYTDSDDD